MRLSRFSLPSLLGGAALLLGCSSNGTVSTTTDSGVSTPDGSISDGGASDGGNTASNADSSAADSGPQCLTPGVTADACRTCCENAYPAGYNVFSKLLVVCACESQYCGPLEGGAPEAGVGDSGSDDAGDSGGSDASASGGEDSGASSYDGGYGQAVCSPATCAYTAEPSSDCSTCIYETLGTGVSSAGPCLSTVLADCFNDSTCLAFFGCAQNCPPE